MDVPGKEYVLICGYKNDTHDQGTRMSAQFPYKTGFVTGEGTHGLDACTFEGTISLEDRVVTLDLQAFTGNQQVHLKLSGKEHETMKEIYLIDGQAKTSNAPESSQKNGFGFFYSQP